MRITNVLNRQHIQFMFKKHWHLFGQRKVQETNIAETLEARGINVADPERYLKETKTKKPFLV